MEKKNIIRRIIGYALAILTLKRLFMKFENRLTPKPINVSMELQTTDMSLLAEKCRKQLSQNREECSKEFSGKAEHQTAALLLDCEECGADLIKSIRPEAEVLSSNVSTSIFSKFAEFLFGPIISFLIAVVSTGLFISFKWKAEQSLSPEILKMLNPLIIVSAAVAFHLLLNNIRSFVKNSPKREQEITVGVKLSVPDESMVLFKQMQLDRAKKYTEQIAKAYSSPAKLNDPMLQLLSEIYSDIYQAEKTEEMTDIFGYVKPKCAAALKKMDVDIIDSYSEDTAGCFSVIEASYGKSMVLKPALVVKTGGYIINKGEYVKNTEL